jgi:hypothetical protein
MSWTFVQGLPTARSLLAAATCAAPAPQSGVWIYAIGGYDDATNSVFATVEAYDTSTKSWYTPPPIKPMLNARARLAAASGSDGLHALGGVDASGTILATHEIYDPATNGWSPAKTTMPTARAGHAAVTGPDGLIYVIGGYDSPMPGQNQYFNSVDTYDPIKGVWSSPPPSPMSTPRAFHAAVTGDGLIYAIGGFNSGGLVSTVEAYDPKLGQWSAQALTFTGEGLAAAVDPQGLIYAIGGDSANAPLASVYSYDPAHPAAEWTEQYSLQTARDGLAAATGPDGLIYAIGGVGDPLLPNEIGLTLGTVEAYMPGPPPPPPDPCAAIAAQLESFNEADWENPQAALAGLRGLISALRECMQQHGGWPVIRG